MNYKKILSLLLAGVMVLSLASCNGNSGENTETEVTEEVVETTESTEETETTDEGGIGDGTIEGFGNGLEDGAIVIGDDFEDGSTGEWYTYSNGGSFETYVENGELCVDIAKPGMLDYSCQVYRDGFSMNKGCVYEASFDIHCDIDRVMQWRYQINGGDYHPYYEEDAVPIGPDVKHIVANFTMEEDSDPAPRLCFNLGSQGDLDATTPCKVYIDNFTMTITDASNAMALEPLPTPLNVKVNQIGYNPDDQKTVICRYNRDNNVFEIHDAATDEVVYTGTLKEEFINSKSGDSACTSGDFSDFKTPGTYYISVKDFGNSYDFEIKEHIYDDLYASTVHMLYLQRCGMELTSDMAGDFAHPECHMDEATIYGTDKKIDVSGGWHDAGDYGRYVVPGTKTIADLFLTYEEGVGTDSDSLGIPESGNGIPDILDEARWELDFFLKMQADNGGVYHKVTCAVFPETVMPQDETAELIVCPISATATADFAAIMAKAARIYEEYDADYAATCLAASKKAFKFMEKEGADMPGFINPEDISTGEYPDGKSEDEYFWAAVELYITTGDSAYLDKAAEIYLGVKWSSLDLGWANMSGYGAYAYMTRPEDLAGNDELTTGLTGVFNKYATDETTAIAKDAYFISLGYDYPWGSNMTVANHGMLYLMTARVTGNEDFNKYARYQYDYLLGVNPITYCYVTTFGDFSPEHIHHRPSQYMQKPMPGMLVGGPNSNPADPYAKAVLTLRSAAACYVDNESSFSTNEICIYWNSPLIYLVGQYK